ncbi:MAG: chemotaxis protein CheX, partial [Syntrophales bacterium]|nr:chemotaxis protein CheX [Syntrophales bacterium]
MDVRYINPFLEATLEVLKKLTGVESTAGKPYTKVDSTACGDVSGIIGIMGNAVGSLAISFKESCILAITSRVLGEKYEDICRDVFDTVGELTNMISGVARNKMEKVGLKAYAAIPTVIYGKNHVIMHILKSPSIVIPFDTPYGQFFVDVCIKVVEDVQVGVDPSSDFLKEVYKPRAIDVMSEEGHKGKGRHASHAGPAKPLTPEEKINLTRERLDKIIAQRDETMRLLKENPFMEFKRRQALKKLLPVYDEKIKQLKL